MYRNETRWLEWIESIRKDVECNFGILKARWRILKTRVRFYGVKMTDDIWMTCCALHNMSLDVNGNNVSWEGEAGYFDFDEVTDNIPFVLRRLANTWEWCTYDSSGMGPGTSNEDEDEVQDVPIVDNSLEGVIDTNNVNEVRLLSADIFQKKLIEYFDILLKQHKIQWPRKPWNIN